MSLRTDGLIEELKGAIKDSDATYNEIICDAREEAATHKKVRQQLLEDLRKVERDRDIYKESYRNAHKAFGALQDVVLGKGSTTETYDDLLAPVRELVNLKETIRFYLGMNYDSSCVKLVYELRRVLNSGFTEERDSILSEIRKVLGAKDRSDNNPHETALQAAKRVVGDLNHLRYTNESQFNVLLATRKALGLSDSGENIIEEARKVKNASVALRHSYSRLAEAIGFTPHDSVDCVVAYAEDLKKNNGARTYTPPKGFSLVETEDYISKCQDIEKLKSLKGTVCTILGVSKENDPHHLGVRLRFEAEKFAKDSNDLKVIKEKLGLT